MIEQPSPKVYDELLSIWEEAVRSTHHFLTEADIQFYKPLIRHVNILPQSDCTSFAKIQELLQPSWD